MIDKNKLYFYNFIGKYYCEYLDYTAKIIVGINDSVYSVETIDWCGKEPDNVDEIDEYIITNIDMLLKSKKH